MIVDDNPWENQYTRLVLKLIPMVEGYKFFQTGWEAFNYLDICRKSGSCPDVILVDLKLGDMSGFSWVEHFEQAFRQDFAASHTFASWSISPCLCQVHLPVLLLPNPAMPCSLNQPSTRWS